MKFPKDSSKYLNEDGITRSINIYKYCRTTASLQEKIRAGGYSEMNESVCHMLQPPPHKKTKKQSKTLNRLSGCNNLTVGIQIKKGMIFQHYHNGKASPRVLCHVLGTTLTNIDKLKCIQKSNKNYKNTEKMMHIPRKVSRNGTILVW